MLIWSPGDQLTYAANKNPAFHKHFLTMCPSYAFVDRSTGYFNRSMGFEKDYAAILSVLWSISMTMENYFENPCEETHNALVKAGLPTPFDNLEDEHSVIDWDGTGIDPIFKTKGVG